jgi:hypothetical protein
MDKKIWTDAEGSSHVQGDSNMTGADLCVNKPHSVPVIFEPPCISRRCFGSRLVWKGTRRQPSPARSRTGYTSKEFQILDNAVLSFLVSDLKQLADKISNVPTYNEISRLLHFTLIVKEQDHHQAKKRLLNCAWRLSCSLTMVRRTIRFPGSSTLVVSS